MASLFDKKMRYLGCDGENACTYGPKGENVQNIWFTGIFYDLCQQLTFIESGRSLTTLVIRVRMDIFFFKKPLPIWIWNRNHTYFDMTTEKNAFSKVIISRLWLRIPLYLRMCIRHWTIVICTKTRPDTRQYSRGRLGRSSTAEIGRNSEMWPTDRRTDGRTDRPTRQGAESRVRD